MLAFVAYQLWGTGLQTARAQSELRAELGRAFPERPIPGRAAGVIIIPRIALDMAFVQGIGPKALARGPGHYPSSPWPGEGGNVAIAGHRTTHLAPFWALDSLRRGDEIIIRTRQGTFVYRVMWKGVGPPTATWVLSPTDDPILTLTTCNPRFSARERLIVRAKQVYGKTPNGFLGQKAARLGAVGFGSAAA